MQGIHNSSDFRDARNVNNRSQDAAWGSLFGTRSHKENVLPPRTFQDPATLPRTQLRLLASGKLSRGKRKLKNWTSFGTSQQWPSISANRVGFGSNSAEEPARWLLNAPLTAPWLRKVHHGRVHRLDPGEERGGTPSGKRTRCYPTTTAPR